MNHVFIFQSKEHINNQAINETSAKLVKAGSLLLGMYDTAALKSSITTVDASCNQAIAFSLLSEKKCNSLYVYMAVQLVRGVYRIVHKKLERECERKACKYKEFERFSGG